MLAVVLRVRRACFFSFSFFGFVFILRTICEIRIHPVPVARPTFSRSASRMHSGPLAGPLNSLRVIGLPGNGTTSFCKKKEAKNVARSHRKT